MTLAIAKLRAETLALLDGTTPGPWQQGEILSQAVLNWNVPPNHPQSCICQTNLDANARMIAAAPALAAETLALLDEIERLRGENDKLRADMSSGSFYQEKDIDAMLDEIERLRTALEWYGEQARLCRLIHSGGDQGRHALQADGGKRARAAIAALTAAPQPRRCAECDCEGGEYECNWIGPPA